jgi:pseudouridine synthase
MLAGRVRVNGGVVTELGTRVVPDRDEVEVDGRPVVLPEVRWIALNKPSGFLCTRKDTHGGATVYHILPEEMSGLRYVGRLDRDTEGLLLLTNEGDASHALLHPSREVEREYAAWVEGVPTSATLARLMRGVELDDGPALAKRAALVERTAGGARLSLVMIEGRKREVRRLLEAVGHPVVRLVRMRFGPIELGDLPSGSWRELSEEERRLLVERSRNR